MEALQNIKMVEAARTEAQALIAEDETLSQWPEVKRRAESKETTEVHFE
jgi:hypothetical protein